MMDNLIREKLAELKALADKSNQDISRELGAIEAKLRASGPAAPAAAPNVAWKRVELARHPEKAYDTPVRGKNFRRLPGAPRGPDVRG